jgi:dethiobiotin synthetase
MRRFFITSTGTDCGKTFITRLLCHQLRSKQLTVQALKPVISGYTSENMHISDAGLLLDACGLTVNAETIDAISPWRFTAPLSPHTAATQDHTSIAWDALLAWCHQALHRPYDIHLIEGAGGVMAPLSYTHTMRDWMKALDIPTLLVTNNYLGSISHTLSAWEALQQRNIDVRAIIINQPAPDANAPPLDDLITTLQSFTHPHIPIMHIPFSAMSIFTSQSTHAEASCHTTLPDLTSILW